MAVKNKRIYGAGLVKVVATVAPEDKAYLTKLGHGNASKGLRELISKARSGK